MPDATPLDNLVTTGLTDTDLLRLNPGPNFHMPGTITRDPRYRLNHKRLRWIPLAVGIAALLACGQSEPLTPAGAIVAPGGLGASRGGQTTGLEITVLDNDGLSFTLDVARAEIRVGNGKVITLSPEQVAEAATEFMGAVESDPVAWGNAVEAPCGDSGGCVEPTVSPSDLEDSHFRYELLTSGSTRPGGRVGWRVLGGTNMDKGQGKPGTGGGGLTTMDWPSNCTNIKLAFLEVAASYRDSRQSVLEVLKEVASSTFEIDQYGRPTVHLPNLPMMAGAFQVTAAGNRATRIRLNLISWMYTGSGCGTIQMAGSTLSSSNGGNAGSLQVVCHEETWQISVDGGQTWKNIRVDVCEFATQ